MIALLLVCLCTAACAPAQNTARTPIPLTRAPYEMPERQPVWATLYYPSEDASRVLAFSQPPTQNDSFYDNLMDALLSGTPEGYESCFPAGITCRAIQLTQNVLNIDLSWQFQHLKAEPFYACLSVLISTFTALPEVDFINLTVEGEQLRAPATEEPILLLSSYSGTIGELLTRHNDILRNGIPRLSVQYAVLYGADDSGQFLLPAASGIPVYNGDIASALLRSLLASGNALFSDGFSLAGEPVMQDGELSVSLRCPRAWSVPDGWLGPAALLCTLSCLYASVSRLRLTVTDADENTVFTGEENAADAYARIRSRIDIITPGASGTQLAHTVMLVARMPGKSDLKRFTEEYLSTLSPQLRETDSVVNDVVQMGDTVWIDLKSEYFERFAIDLSPEAEYAVVYSLIASVCSYCGASRAMLLEDHQARSTFAGSIALDQPLLTLPKAFLDRFA